MASTGDEKNLAVIGAGPKAAALAARVAAIIRWRKANPALAAAVRPPPTLHVFESSSRIAAHWYGDAGYTDGSYVAHAGIAAGRGERAFYN